LRLAHIQLIRYSDAMKQARNTRWIGKYR